MFRECSLSVSAFILIEVLGDHTKSVFKTIKRIEGVKSLNVITGSYDIIALVEAESLNELSDTILSRLRSVDGVTKTVTNIILDLKSLSPTVSPA